MEKSWSLDSGGEKNKKEKKKSPPIWLGPSLGWRKPLNLECHVGTLKCLLCLVVLVKFCSSVSSAIVREQWMAIQGAVRQLENHITTLAAQNNTRERFESHGSKFRASKIHWSFMNWDCLWGTSAFHVLGSLQIPYVSVRREARISTRGNCLLVFPAFTQFCVSSSLLLSWNSGILVSHLSVALLDGLAWSVLSCPWYSSISPQADRLASCWLSAPSAVNRKRNPWRFTQVTKALPEGPGLGLILSLLLA